VIVLAIVPPLLAGAWGDLDDLWRDEGYRHCHELGRTRYGHRLAYERPFLESRGTLMFRFTIRDVLWGAFLGQIDQ
jgi:hypothetical protein